MFKQQKKEKKSVLIAINLPQLIAYYVLTKRCYCSSAPRQLAPQMKLMNMGYIYSSHFNKIKGTFSTHLDGREMMCPSSRKWNLDGLGPLLIAHKEPFPSPFVLSSAYLMVKFKF